MNLLVLSDLHLSPDSAERNQEFLNFLEAALKNNDHVLIVGDLFDLWLGWDALTMRFQKPILDRMRELAQSGLRMDYVEGNRDFAIDQVQGVFQQVCSRSWQKKWCGRSVYAEHGDLVNSSDLPYRMWRKLTKSRAAYFLMDRLPAFFTMRTALKLERQLRATNRKHKMYYPDESVKDFCKRLSESGVDIILLGHFHTEKRIEIQWNSRNVLFYNLPGWEHGFRFLVIPSGDAVPYFTDWGK